MRSRGLVEASMKNYPWMKNATDGEFGENPNEGFWDGVKYQTRADKIGNGTAVEAQRAMEYVDRLYNITNPDFGMNYNEDAWKGYKYVSRGDVTWIPLILEADRAMEYMMNDSLTETLMS